MYVVVGKYSCVFVVMKKCIVVGVIVVIMCVYNVVWGVVI